MMYVYFSLYSAVFLLQRNNNDNDTPTLFVCFSDRISIPLDVGLVFDAQFMQITLQLNSSTNYGFGEHNHRRLKLDMNHRTWAIFTRDMAPVVSLNP